MYIIDISHNLEQQELADIWQGLMCKSMQEISKEENEITHEFTKHDFFYQKELPDDMKFFVFKIKQKAKQNYYDIVKETSSDKRFTLISREIMKKKLYLSIITIGHMIIARL